LITAVATANAKKDLDYLAKTDRSIWVVNSPSNAAKRLSAVKVPAPLTISKRPSTATANTDSLQGESDPSRRESTKSSDWQTTVSRSTRDSSGVDSPKTLQPRKSMTFWFRRSSKDYIANGTSNAAKPSHQVSVSTAATTDPIRTDSQFTATPVPPATKKKGFRFNIWGSSKSEFRLSLAGPEYQETPSPDTTERQKSNPYQSGPNINVSAIWENGGHGTDSSRGTRKIEVRQNWLARLFHIKPPTRYMCFSISKRRVRQEIVLVLREWRKYGIKDVQVDKERNIVFARVSSKNCNSLQSFLPMHLTVTIFEKATRFN
jgi:serine/threonine-protein kinase HSL1, negative regulator of Swe1 kinase